MATVLITGSSRGIGHALAKEFLRQGEEVIATARNPDKSPELMDLAKQYPSPPLYIEQMDVAVQESVDRVASKMKDTVACIDVVINNAGIFPDHGDERLDELEMSRFNTAFEVNVVGAARVSQAFIPLLSKSERGRIVNISSGAGSISDKTDSRNICYSVSKAALNQLSRAMAAALKPDGIIVVPITPGWVKTDMGGENADITPDEAAASLVATVRKLTMKQTGLFLDRHGRSGVYNW